LEGINRYRYGRDLFERYQLVSITAVQEGSFIVNEDFHRLAAAGYAYAGEAFPNFG
jgi:hypothetical protein